MIAPQLLAQVAEHTHIPVVITDAQGITVWVNRAFEQLTGHTLAQVRGQRPGTVLQGAQTDAAQVQRLRALLRAGQPVVGLELLNHRRDGTPYWIALDINPVFDEAGQLSHFISVQTPTSAHHQQQRALAALSQRLAQALGAARVGVWEAQAGPDGLQLLLDDQARLMLGADAAPPTPAPTPFGTPATPHAQPVPWSALPAALALWPAAAAQALTSGVPMALEAWVDVPGQPPRYLQLSGQRSVDLPAARLTGVLTDGTRGRDHQAQVDATALADMLRLERQEVLQRLKREFRLPLNTLLGAAQQARADAQRSQADSLAARLGQITTAGQQLLDMLDELLHTAAAQGDTALDRQPSLQPVALTDVLRRQWPHSLKLDPSAAGQAATQPAPRLPMVWADPTRLRRALSLASGLVPVEACGGPAGTPPCLTARQDLRPQRLSLRFDYPAAAPALAGEPGTPALDADAALRLELVRRLTADMGGDCDSALLVRGNLQLTLHLRLALGLGSDAEPG